MKNESLNCFSKNIINNDLDFHKEKRHYAKNIEEIINNSSNLIFKKSLIKGKKEKVVNKENDDTNNRYNQEKERILIEENSHYKPNNSLKLAKKGAQETVNYVNDEEYFFNQDEIIDQIINDKNNENSKDKFINNGNKETSKNNLNNKFISVIINNNVININAYNQNQNLNDIQKIDSNKKIIRKFPGNNLVKL